MHEGLLTLRMLSTLVGLVASSTYLVLYLFQSGRSKTLVGNMLLHLGWVMWISFANTMVRALFFPPDALRPTPELLLLLLLNVAMTSLAVMVLSSYLAIQRSSKRLDDRQDDDLI